MLPVIFKLGPFTLYSFGVCLLIGFVLALFVVWKKALEEHFDEDEVLDSLLASGLWGLVGARLMYVLFHFEVFGLNPLLWLNLLGKPGFTFFGGLAAGVMALYFQTKKRKWNFYEFADLVFMGLALLLVFGWLGSFLNGSSFGLPTESILGVRFAGMFDKRQPVQLYASFGYLLLFGFLVWAEGRYRTFTWYRAGKSGVRSGFLVFNFMIFMGLIQLIISWLSPPAVIVRGVVLDGWLWGLFVLLGMVGLYWRSGRDFSKDIKSLYPGSRKAV